MSAYVQDTQLLTRRSVVLVAIIALHILIVWAIATGLAHRAIEMVAPPIIADVVQQQQQKDQPPPPPPPQLEHPPVEVPPPEVQIDLPPEPQSTAIRDTTNRHIIARPPPPPRPPHRVVFVSARPGPRFPNTDDYYPPASQRLGESGGVNVRACVGPDGRLTSAPTVAKTSGSSRLDEGALRLARAGSGRYTPATADGKPINSCFVFRVTFVLK